MVNITLKPESFPKKLTWYLWLACCGLVACDSILTFYDITGYYVFNRVFDMTREESIPNWYASILLFCIALTCLLTFAIPRCYAHFLNLAVINETAVKKPASFEAGFSIGYVL